MSTHDQPLGEGPELPAQSATKRTLKLYVQVGDIILWDPDVAGQILTGEPDEALKFEFKEGAVTGLVSLSPYMDRGVEYELGVDQSGAAFGWPTLCTAISVVVDGLCEKGAGDEEFFEASRRVTDTYVNRMLAYLRANLGHHWLKPIPIAEWGTNYFLLKTDAVWVQGETETEARGKGAVFAFMYEQRQDFDDRAAALYRSRLQGLEDFMRHESQVPVERRLIASAKEHFVTREYGAAAVEIVSALEVGLYGFVERQIRERQAFGRFKDVRPNAATLLKAVLPLAATPEQWQLCRGFIDDCTQVVKTRNTVTHHGVQPTPEEVEKIRRGIVASEDLLDVLGSGLAGLGGYVAVRRKARK
jgi:hypothetical protein